jgi:hypothetical protein
VLVSAFIQVGLGLIPFLIFFVRIMCVRYLIAMWEKDSISLWILELGICRSWRSLTIVVCVVPHMFSCNCNGWWYNLA